MTVLYTQICSSRKPRCELNGVVYTRKQHEQMDEYRKKICPECVKPCEFEKQPIDGIPGRKGPGILLKPKKIKKRGDRHGKKERFH